MKHIIFYLLLFNQILVAEGTIYVEAKIAIKLIEKKDIQFISAQDNIEIIKGSKILNIAALSLPNILGSTPCSPYLICPDKLKNILSDIGVASNQKIILYDNSYGIYAAQLYSALESIGHNNIMILNGGTNSIAKIDPNRKTYVKYYSELNSLMNSMEDNKTTDTIENLKEKLKVLKPLLLVQKEIISIKSLMRKDYKILKKSKNYFLSKSDLLRAVEKVRLSSESNISIIDVCPMVDIVGDKSGSYISGVTPLSWKKIIDRVEKGIQSKEELVSFFKNHGIKKENSNYLYCMSGSAKALFMMTAMREAGYLKVKTFTGDWNVWVGDINE